MTDALKQKYGYPDLTDEVKAKIFGSNAARLFNVNIADARKAISSDKLTKAKQEYQQNPEPSNAQYGWICLNEQTTPTSPIGE